MNVYCKAESYNVDLFCFKDMEPYSLRSKGLCLVPISFTAGVASSNGADIWAPIKTRRPVSDEDSVITHC